MPICPDCGSQRTWKDGLRYVQGTPIQRFLCRSCGYRFSENNYKECQTTRGRQICAVQTRTVKNLTEVESTTQTQRESDQQQGFRGEIVAFGWHMQKRGLSEATIKHRIYRLNSLVKLGADLNTPDTIEVILVTSEWSKANKKVFADCYKTYCNYKKIDWDKPKFIVPQKEPFLPLEEEVQQLIAGCGKKTGTLLQLLFETGVRIGEASLLKWTDLDFKANNLRVNCPEKGGNSRTIDISNKLISMLKALPKRKDGHIFNPISRTHGSTFNKQRNRLAIRLGNPRLKDIHFHTLRHLRATLAYYASDGDILKVKYLLGHKRLDTTGRYAHYQAFKKEEYKTVRVTVETTREEEDQLNNTGYKFVRYDENRKEAIYRKRL